MLLFRLTGCKKGPSGPLNVVISFDLLQNRGSVKAKKQQNVVISFDLLHDDGFYIKL